LSSVFGFTSIGHRRRLLRGPLGVLGSEFIRLSDYRSPRHSQTTTMATRVEHPETQVSPLARLGEQLRQLVLIDSLEEGGVLTVKTATCYRLHVLRGGSIFGFPVDGPNAPQAVKRWRQTERALQLDASRQRLSARIERAGHLPAPSVRKRGSARAPRRRSVRTAGAQARSPGSSNDDDPAGPPLSAVPSRGAG